MRVTFYMGSALHQGLRMGVNRGRALDTTSRVRFPRFLLPGQPEGLEPIEHGQSPDRARIEPGIEPR